MADLTIAKLIAPNFDAIEDLSRDIINQDGGNTCAQSF